jgi:cbb3-type cytochrome c oxidase subunit III
VNATVLVIGILALAGVVVIGLLILNATRDRRAIENVPPAMRPGYSDEQLERSVLERYMAWGVVLTLFFAVFFPVYWIRETNRVTQATEERFVSQVVRGEELYAENCAQCHGTNAGGGGAPSPYDSESIWPAPNLRSFVVRYEANRNVADPVDLLEQTIHRGRPGTPMPAWGEIAGGPLTDDEIDAIVQFLLANQEGETAMAEADAASNVSGEQLYVDNCLRCHGPDFQGVQGEEGRPGATLVGLFERHSEESILGILRNGIRVPNQVLMPPWQEGYMYEGARYTDEALQKIIDYLGEQDEVRGDPAAADDAEDDDGDDGGDADAEDESQQAAANRSGA